MLLLKPWRRWGWKRLCRQTGAGDSVRNMQLLPKWRQCVGGGALGSDEMEYWPMMDLWQPTGHQRRRYCSTNDQRRRWRRSLAANDGDLVVDDGALAVKAILGFHNFNRAKSSLSEIRNWLNHSLILLS